MGIGKLAGSLGEDSKKPPKTSKKPSKVEEAPADENKKPSTAGPTPAVQKAMVEMGERFAELHAQIRELEAEKDKLKSLLLPFLEEHCGAAGKLTLPDATVLAIKVSSSKRPTKGDLVEALGEEEAEKFWDGLVPKDSTYIEVKRV